MRCAPLHPPPWNFRPQTLYIYMYIYICVSSGIRKADFGRVEYAGTLRESAVRAPRKVDVRLPGKGNSNSHGARLVHPPRGVRRNSPRKCGARPSTLPLLYFHSSVIQKCICLNYEPSTEPLRPPPCNCRPQTLYTPLELRALKISANVRWADSGPYCLICVSRHVGLAVHRGRWASGPYCLVCVERQILVKTF